MGEGLSTFGAFKILFNVGSVSLGLKRKLFEGVVVSTATKGVQTSSVTLTDTHKRDVLEKNVYEGSAESPGW